MVDDSPHGIEAVRAAAMVKIGFVNPADDRSGRAAVLVEADALSVVMGAAKLPQAFAVANVHWAGGSLPSIVEQATCDHGSGFARQACARYRRRKACGCAGRDALRLDQLCGELGRSAFAVVTNLNEPRSAEAMVRAILAQSEKIDIFHANAAPMWADRSPRATPINGIACSISTSKRRFVPFGRCCRT